MSKPILNQKTATEAEQIQELTELFRQTREQTHEWDPGYVPIVEAVGRIIRVCDSGLRAGCREDLAQLAVCFVALSALLDEMNWHLKRGRDACVSPVARLAEQVLTATREQVLWRSDALDAQGVCSAYGKDFDEFVRDFNCDLSDAECFERDGETVWVKESEAMRLVQWCDAAFELELHDMFRHKLFRAPDRERHQASFADQCPELYRLMFPNVPADAAGFDTDNDE